MKTHTCDICGNQIDKDNPAPASGSQEARFIVGDKVLPFTFWLRVETWKFGATDFDVCQKCLFKALSNTATVPAPAPKA